MTDERDVVARVLAAVAQGTPAAATLDLHPYLHWTTSDGHALPAQPTLARRRTVPSPCVGSTFRLGLVNDP